MVAHQAPITVAEYLAMEASSQVKHEFVDGTVYAMAGGTITHDRIANNVRAALVTHLGDGLSLPLGPDVRLRVSPTIYYYLDALVTCDNDRGDKFANYQTLLSFEEYVLVGTRRRVVERYHRAERGRWTYQRYGPDEEVTLETIGLTIPVARLYVGARVLG